MSKKQAIALSTHPYWRCYDIFGDPPRMLAGAFYEKNYSCGMHLHDFYELCYIVEGSCTHLIGDKTIRGNKNTLVVIPPGIMHGIVSDDGNLQVYNAFFHRLFCQEYKHDLESLVAFPLLFNTEPAQCSDCERYVLSLKDNQSQTIKCAVEKLSTEMLANGAKSETLLNSLGLQLVAEVCKAYQCNKLPDVIPGSRCHDAILNCIKYINDNYTGKITIDKLCEISYLSRSALRRNFISVMGITPMRYIDGFRLLKARELLQNTVKSISDISLSCGFYDCAHFCRSFRRQNGISPHEFRARYANTPQVFNNKEYL